MTTPRRNIAPLILALTVIATGSIAAGVATDLETLLSDAYPADDPGVTALVARDGEILLRAGYGMADLERDVPNAPDMVFRIGSITKQFTAVGIMMLVEEGKLSVDDPIETHLPGYPTHGRAITIEHLLTHTSGIKGYTEIPEVMETAYLDRTVEEVLDTFKDLDLLFEPGTEWRYSNSGYFLLGAIIEAVSGMSYAEFVETRIFGPLGMTGSYYGSTERIIPRRALGYHWLNDRYINAPHISMSLPYAAGSLLSTVDDLLRWQQALESDELVTAATRERMWTPYTLSGGEATSYGYGWAIGEFDGDLLVMHSGGIHGFLTFSASIPARKIFAAVLSNNPEHGLDPAVPARQAIALASGETLPVAATDLDPAILDQYVGVYRINDEETRVVTVEDGVLFTQRTGGGNQPVTPITATDFFYPRSLSRLRFELDDDGRVVRMHLKPWGGQEQPADLTDEPLPTGPEVADVDPAIYDRYVGTYELMPGFELTVRRDGDRLLTMATGQGEVEVYPSSETEFFLTVVDARLEFVIEDGAEAASAVILRQGGAELTGQRTK